MQALKAALTSTAHRGRAALEVVPACTAEAVHAALARALQAASSAAAVLRVAGASIGLRAGKDGATVSGADITRQIYPCGQANQHRTDDCGSKSTSEAEALRAQLARCQAEVQARARYPTLWCNRLGQEHTIRRSIPHPQPLKLPCRSCGL